MILSVARRRVQISLLALFLGLATVMTYRLVWHGGFIWDDDRYVTHNHLLTAPDGLRRIWFSLDAPSQYFPLAYTVLRIERLFWDLQPAGYHWVVAWISELKNVLMGFFFLLTLLAWVEYVDPTNKHRRVFYVAALIFYLLALFAKSTACTLPAALLLILWLKARPIGRRALLEIAPFIVLALGIGLVAVWWEKYHQGTRTLVSLGPIDRLLIASRAVWFYLSKIFWPSDLTFIYPRWQIDARNPVAYLWLVVAGAVAVAIYFGRRVFGRSVEVAALFFVATLSPLLGFIMLYTFRYTFVADHYQYLASIGPIALTSAGLTTLSRSFKSLQWLVFGGAVVILAGLSLLSWRQSAMYRDMETLWRTTIAKNPGCWMAYNNLGVVQFEKGNIDDAIDKYEEALRLHADYPEAHYNLGSALLQQGKIDDAIQQCEKALELQPTDPDAHVVLGNAFLAKQDLDGAISQYERALTLRPEDFKAHYNLAIAFQEKGETEAAAREYERARRFGAQE